MIRVFRGFEREDNSLLFQAMYNQRALALIAASQGRPEWRDGGQDPWDREDAVYLMAFDADQRLTGSVRLMSSLGPHFLSDPSQTSFPHVRFSMPSLWEASRFSFSAETSPLRNRVPAAAGELLFGLCRFGLDYGLSRIASVYDAELMGLWRRCGVPVVEIGRATTPEGRVLFVGTVEISEALETAIGEATGLQWEVPKQAA